MSYYVKPRMTEDINLLFLSEQDISMLVEGFERSQDRAFSHKATRVEVDLSTPASLGIPLESARKTHRTALVDKGVKIASPSALVTLKRHRLNSQDKADIATLSDTTAISGQSRGNCQ